MTIGGCIANDIHGKAHHSQGSFVTCVESMRVMLADGTVVSTSREENADLFTRMKNGEFADGSRTLRAKIDMASPNMHMRDPVLYRIRKLIFAALLAGRRVYGWRGRVAVRWTLAGFLALVLAYIGTKFVIEIILGRS